MGCGLQPHPPSCAGLSSIYISSYISSSAYFQNNGNLIDWVCQVIDRNNGVNHNKIYFQPLLCSCSCCHQPQTSFFSLVCFNSICLCRVIDESALTVWLITKRLSVSKVPKGGSQLSFQFHVVWKTSKGLTLCSSSRKSNHTATLACFPRCKRHRIL